MVGLHSEILRFVKLSQRIKSDGEFQSYSLDVIETVLRGFEIPKDVITWYQVAAPSSVVIPWLTNHLTLYDPAKLPLHQNGYSWRYNEAENKVEPIDGWDNTWVVIGDIGGDPVIVDGSDTNKSPVYYALHGIGIWNPAAITPSILDFLRGVVVWLEILQHYENVSQMYDDNSEVRVEILAHITHTLSKFLTGIYFGRFLACLLGDVSPFLPDS